MIDVDEDERTVEDLLDELDDPERAYPVLVTVSTEHVVWVEADSHDQAVKLMQDDGDWYERISDQTTAVDQGVDIRKPGRWEWHHVYEAWDAAISMNCDAHVEEHHAALARQRRAARVKACTTAGHPQLEVRGHTKDEAFCPTCGRLKLAQIVTDLRAAGERRVGVDE